MRPAARTARKGREQLRKSRFTSTRLIDSQTPSRPPTRSERPDFRPQEMRKAFNLNRPRQIKCPRLRTVFGPPSDPLATDRPAPLHNHSITANVFDKTFARSTVKHPPSHYTRSERPASLPPGTRKRSTAIVPDGLNVSASGPPSDTLATDRPAPLHNHSSPANVFDKTFARKAEKTYLCSTLFH